MAFLPRLKSRTRSECSRFGAHTPTHSPFLQGRKQHGEYLSAANSRMMGERASAQQTSASSNFPSRVCCALQVAHVLFKELENVHTHQARASADETSYTFPPSKHMIEMGTCYVLQFLRAAGSTTNTTHASPAKLNT